MATSTSFWPIRDESDDHANRRLVQAIILLAILCILFWPAWKSLLHAWETKDHASHGYLVLPISLWLCWSIRNRWAELRVEGSYVGYCFLLLGLPLAVLGTVARADTLVNLAMMLSVTGIVLCILGPAVLRAFIFPFLFLVFLFPIPDAIYVSVTNPLKLFVTDVATALIMFVGIPVYQEGNLITFANLALEVVEACSGLNSLVAYLMLATLLASVMTGTIIRKLTLVLIAFPVALIVNIARITGTGVLGHYYGPDVATGFFHEFSGLAAFGVGFVFIAGMYGMLAQVALKDNAA